MKIELELSMSEFSTRISKVYAPIDSEHRFHKKRIENWLPIGIDLGPPS